MPSAAKEPADREPAASPAGRRPPLAVRAPQAVGLGGRRVIVHLPDLTAGKARPLDKPATEKPAPSPAPKNVREGKRIDAAVSGPSAIPSPHYEQTVAPTTAPAAPQPYANALPAAAPTWQVANWKTRIAAMQPTIMLALVGIAAGVLIGWLWTGGRENQSPMAPAPAWQQTNEQPRVVIPDDPGVGNAAEALWDNDQQPSMPSKPPVTTDDALGNDPYGPPPPIEVHVPEAADSGISPRLDGTIEDYDPTPAEAANESARPGLY